jgi:hypothetical protein
LKEYIKNLTDQFIGKHSIDAMWNCSIESATNDRERLAKKKQFGPYITKFIYNKEVLKMNHSTLGEIWGNVDVNEMGFNWLDEIQNEVQILIPSHPGNIQQRIVAKFLATAITMRLWPESIPLENCSVVEPYKMKPDSLIFVRFAPSKIGNSMEAVFRNGEGREYSFNRHEVVVKAETCGDPIWFQLDRECWKNH